MSVAIERAGSNELWPQILPTVPRGVLSKVIEEIQNLMTSTVQGKETSTIKKKPSAHYGRFHNNTLIEPSGTSAMRYSYTYN